MCLPTVEPSVHETKKLVCSENIVYGCSMSGSRIVIKIFEKNFLFQTRLDNSIHIHVHTRICILINQYFHLIISVFLLQIVKSNITVKLLLKISISHLFAGELSNVYQVMVCLHQYVPITGESTLMRLSLSQGE